ncbi:MAG: hypothetical protein PHW13_11370 [Methylococcales bacterium]|nr:hypothetical protein [Methylococcales bacterium]
MQTGKLIIILLGIGFCHPLWAQAPGGGHAGHGGGGGANVSGDASCFKAKISHYKPEHLATVAPGSEFSFTVSGSNGPGNIFVSIRQQPIHVEVDAKETFYLVKGRLPPELKNETVRISVQARAKMNKCDAEGGILLKVAE